MASREGAAGHPIIVSYGETSAMDCPLILIVGREPNSDEPICDEVGRYDFRTSPHCGFWNASYAALARLIDLSAGEFKKECVRRSGSPLIFADALPHALPVSTSDKQRRRRLIPEHTVRMHIERIFAKPICGRLGLVILSGLQDHVFCLSRELIASHCAERTVALEHLPFFANQNARAIRRAMTTDTEQRMRRITQRFMWVSQKPHRATEQLSHARRTGP